MTPRFARINIFKQFFNLHIIGIVKIKGKWRVDVPKMFMYGNNTRMVFGVLPIITVIYSCNTVSGLYEVIIKKLCNYTPLRYDNIVFLKNNGRYAFQNSRGFSDDVDFFLKKRSLIAFLLRPHRKLEPPLTQTVFSSLHRLIYQGSTVLNRTD